MLGLGLSLGATLGLLELIFEVADTSFESFDLLLECHGGFHLIPEQVEGMLESIHLLHHGGSVQVLHHAC